MAKHHTVQDKYLAQWKKTETDNQLNIYVIPENKIIERGPRWKGFWREDFNMLDEGEKPYLPEDVTALIDTKGIDAIRKIDPLKQEQLTGMDRSCVAFYVALQYIRTPRHREEVDKLIEAQTQYFMSKDLSAPEKMGLTKEKVLEHIPQNDYEKKALEQVKGMTQEEINKQLFDTISNKEYHVELTNAGHSKGILKVDRFAKKVFEIQWLFLIAPQGSSFITSDNPCFTIAPGKIMNGLLSPLATVIFPLRPDICVYIRPGKISKVEHYMRLNRKEVRDINAIILSNSYQCAVAKDQAHLEHLVKGYDHANHRKSRDVAVSESGDYVMFNVE